MVAHCYHSDFNTKCHIVTGLHKCQKIKINKYNMRIKEDKNSFKNKQIQVKFKINKTNMATYNKTFRKSNKIKSEEVG